jgi:Fe2+ or Zn2+ uptake regulation protein
MRCMKIECLPSLRNDEAEALSSAAEGREVREVSITLTGLCADCLGKEP